MKNNYLPTLSPAISLALEATTFTTRIYEYKIKCIFNTCEMDPKESFKILTFGCYSPFQESIIHKNR